MLKLFRRTRPQPLPDGGDPLRIRDLMDDPQLRAVMGPIEESVVTPLRRIDRERRAAADLFAGTRAA